MRNMVIIGSGPAGLTAAVYAARANLQPLLIEGKEPGGQLTLTTLVENYPGFSEGIMGPQLMDEMRKQAQRFGAEIVNGYVHAVKLEEHPFRVCYGDREVETKTVMISTGSSAKLIGIESEIQLMGHGVSTCATCDGFFFRGKEDRRGGRRRFRDGRGDLSDEIRHRSESVIHRREVLPRVKNHAGSGARAIQRSSSILNTVVEEVVGSKETGVTGLKLRNVKTSDASELKVDGMFVAIGHNPNTDIFKGQIDLDEQGYIKTQPDSTRTNIPGVFACGDVQDPVFRQAITAAGTGCMAAIEAERWLEH